MNSQEGCLRRGSAFDQITLRTQYALIKIGAFAEVLLSQSERMCRTDVYKRAKPAKQGRIRNMYVLVRPMSAQWLYIRGSHAVTRGVSSHEACIRKSDTSAAGIHLQA